MTSETKLTAALLEVLESLLPSLYNPFEPQNQSAAYRRVEAAVALAKTGTQDDSTKKLSTFTNHSRRQWTEEECRLMVNAALCKLIDDAGGVMTISVSDLLRVAPMGTLAMSLSDDDKILTLTRVKGGN